VTDHLVAFLARPRARRSRADGSRAFAGLLAGAGVAFGGVIAGCGLFDWASQCSRNLNMPGCTGPMASGGMGTTSTGGTGATGGHGTGGTGSTSASGGQGGCNDASECSPVPWGPCHDLGTVTCTGRMCGVTYTPGPAPSQVYGNCMQNRCDGTGNMSAVEDDTNAPASDDSCRTYVCVLGVPKPKLLAQGASCPLLGTTTGYCDVPADPANTTPEVCAACDSFNPTTTCTAPFQCSSGKCVPQSCTNMKQDGGETDTDCGGPSCLPCVANQKCTAPTDCFSGVCVGGTCQAPTCGDHVMNGDETGVDCGGKTCPACGVNNGCTLPTDCQSDVCKPSAPGAPLKCQMPSCFDGVKNGDETGVDCGSPPDSGVACPPCAGM
jgi:hypothetical protein